MGKIKKPGKEADASDELNLVYGVDPNSIYVSETSGKQEINSIAFNIANPHQTAQICFVNPDNLKPTDDLPSYGEPYEKYNLSWFYIWFPWGSGKGNFTTSEAGENITVSPAPDNLEWYCVKKSSNSIGTYWTLFPKKATVIDPMESIAFIIDNIVSLTPDGMSLMYIESHKIPGFDSAKESQTIWKKKKVVELAIRSFYFEPETIAKGAKTTLQWETVGSKSCVINPGNMDVALSGQMDLHPDEDKIYTLKASDEAKSCRANAQIYIGSVSIESFEAVPANVEKKGDSVALKWKTSYASTCAIDQGIGTVEDVGSRVLCPEKPIKYTITCNGKNGPVQKTVQIETMWARINKFNYKITKEQDGWDPKSGNIWVINHSFVEWDTSYLKSCSIIEKSTGKILSNQANGKIEVSNAQAVYQLIGIPSSESMDKIVSEIEKKWCPDREWLDD
ncbi:Uncharacterised protein [uncultured archaeon]|nr:Uncharacterised protein [uncultured archaeon]